MPSALEPETAHRFLPFTWNRRSSVCAARRGLYLNREIMQQLAESMYALKHRSASATSSSRASVSSRNRHSRTAFLPTRMSSTSNFLKPTWRSSTRWTNSSALLPYRMTCCNCGFTAKAAQKICFFPFQISVLLFLFLFISRIPSSLLQVQIQSPLLRLLLNHA